MQVTRQRRISVHKAAQMLYRTQQPSESQLLRVRKLLATGRLQAEGQGTTMEAVADFLARSALHEETPQPAVGLQQVYREGMKEYFLAVLFRRRSQHASRGFRRAVMAGQAAVVLCILALFAGTLRLALAPAPPEQVAVQQWLDRNTIESKVLRWHPPQVDPVNGNTRMRVQYRYNTERGKTIETDRLFTIVAGNVTRVDSDW